ncbi:unnamed protein product [Acanthoscelides obtectus]|uniref:HTH CENPB-type domain-containing protein n=1 Tax=Acanthoscelides obtectus TaxID=200917 RepID=A0A9P0M4G5_ACAOB|nr:unnamed protein product [Acanthoscelides obtectus]CAK1657415.1 Tigger transposable element-derived protein 4 [Acanthoscelides obtectus]
MSKSGKRAFTLREKFTIVSELEQGSSQANICARMAMKKSTVSNIWKNRDKIKNDWKSYSQKKKMRQSLHPQVDDMLFQWFQQKRANNFPISGPMLQIKAEEFGKLIGDYFKCSSGWLDRFKKRHNIVFGKMCGRTKNTAGNASDPSSSFIENSLSTTNSGEKLQSEDPFGATPLQGPSTTISNTNDIPEFDEPESIKIEPIQIKREYYEDESEAPSNKRFCFDDDLSAFGRLVEQKLRMMPTEYGKRLVMQKIEAILHEAESGVYDYPKSDSELPEQCPPFVAVEVDVSCVKQEVEES